ncbi:YncE family protein [Rhodovastum atsumiense]|uniref:YncE family protein n=1 Tax=Rhodovastum atsumiense TaxID=504468 RepID=A0A5M6IUM9_9PROT|nr:hypothetical protein [Rhodovastum atsumiense]KAA5611986.1 hypothetical protein F1189_12060 [Rhodovastum atsumiense]
MTRAFSRRRALAFGAVALAARPAAARLAGTDPALFDIRRYVFVPGVATPTTTIIDADTDRIVDVLTLGVIPRQVLVSRERAKLVATDGQSPRISVVDVFTGESVTIDLPLPARTLSLGVTGRLLAAADPAAGQIALIDLNEDRLLSVVTGLPPLRDVMFAEQDTMIFVAAEGMAGIGVVDVANARLTHEISTQPLHGGITALARTPNGRRLLVQPQDGGQIGVFDLEEGRLAARLASGAGATGIFPSGTGTYLLVPNNTAATLTIFRAERLEESAVLKAAADMNGVYSAWLDSVAFVPSRAARKLLIFDLDTLRPAGAIGLPGTPLRGAVTADSRKLYLPISDPASIVVVDGATRRITAILDLSHAPLTALIAGGWGICH